MSQRLFFWILLLAVAGILIFCAPQKTPRPSLRAPSADTGLFPHPPHIPENPSSLALRQAQAILLLTDRSVPLQHWHSDDDIFQDGLRPPPPTATISVAPKDNQPAPALPSAHTQMTYFGYMVQGGILFAFVHLDGNDYVIKSGDTLAKTYRACTITPHTICLRHRNNHRTIFLSLGE